MKKVMLFVPVAFSVAALAVSGCASSSVNARGANVFVTPEAVGVKKVAVLPFRAATELIGASVSDVFVTELMKGGNYQLIERSQLSGVLGEAEVSLSGLTNGQAAQLGQMAGANAVIIGTVSEYEMMAYKGRSLPVVGINVRMIDSTSGRILWSIDHARSGSRGTTLAQQSRSVVNEMTTALTRELR